MKRVSIFLGAIFLILVLIAVGGYQLFSYLRRPSNPEITITLIPIPESERNRPAEIDAIKKRSAEIESHIHKLQDEINAEQEKLKLLQSALKNTEGH